MKILAIGAHPDDIEFGCSGFLQKADSRHMVVLSRGEKGCNSEDRATETKKAAHLLQSTIYVYDLKDTQIQIYDAIPILEKEIQTYNPDIILTMYLKDTHQDHKTTFEATKIASRKTQCTVLSYMSPSSEIFSPNWFVSMNEEQMKVKQQSLNFHNSQKNNSYFKNKYIYKVAEYWASMIKSESQYIEPYYLIRHWS